MTPGAMPQDYLWRPAGKNRREHRHKGVPAKAWEPASGTPLKGTLRVLCRSTRLRDSRRTSMEHWPIRSIRR